MEVFTAWLKDKVANRISLPAEIHRDGTHYTALVKVSGRLDSPNSSLSQVVGLFMACQGRQGLSLWMTTEWFASAIFPPIRLIPASLVMEIRK